MPDETEEALLQPQVEMIHVCSKHRLPLCSSVPDRAGAWLSLVFCSRLTCVLDLQILGFFVIPLHVSIHSSGIWRRVVKMTSTVLQSRPNHPL